MVDWGRYHIWIYQIYLLSYLPFRSSLPYSSNPTMSFFLHLRDGWRRPSWSAEPRTTLLVPSRRDPARVTFVGLSPDLPSDTGLTGDPHRSDRYGVEAVQGASLRACWLQKVSNSSFFLPSPDTCYIHISETLHKNARENSPSGT
jgi:hypothetical protein